LENLGKVGKSLENVGWSWKIQVMLENRSIKSNKAIRVPRLGPKACYFNFSISR